MIEYLYEIIIIFPKIHREIKIFYSRTFNTILSFAIRQIEKWQKQEVNAVTMNNLLR